MIVLKIIYSALFFVYMTIALLVVSSFLYVTSIFARDRKEYLFRGAKLWCRYFILPLLTRVRVAGIDNILKNKPVVFVSNHQSYVDIPVILGYIPGSFRFIVKKEFSRIPVFGRFTKASGHLFVDREAGHEAHKTLLQAVDLIHKGKSIVIFPEGTRSRDGKLGIFKRGGLTIAFETGVPIVPIAISGTYNIMKRNSPLLAPGKVTVKIGKPMHVHAGEQSREVYRKTMDHIKAEIEKMLA